MATAFGDYDVQEKIGSPEPGVHAFRASPRGNPRVVELRVIGTPVAKAGLTPDDLFARKNQIEKLSHPNLVRLNEFGTHDGRMFYVIESKEDPTLRDYLAGKKGRLGAELAFDLLTPIGEALRYLHREGLVHGEVSLDTIRIDAISERAYLAVLSIERLLGFPLTRQRSPQQAGRVALPPEVLAGKPWDARADIYQYAGVLLECLTGRPPPEAPTPVEREGAPTSSVQSLAHELGSTGKKLDPLILDAMAYDPGERPESMEALLEMFAPVRENLRQSAIQERNPTHALQLKSIKKKEAKQKANKAFARAEKKTAKGRNPLFHAACWFDGLGAGIKLVLYVALTFGSFRAPIFVGSPVPLLSGQYESNRLAVANRQFDTRSIEEGFREVARASATEPTTVETYGERLRWMRGFVKAIAPEARKEIFSRETYAALRILYVKDRKQGCKKLDEHLASALAWLEENSKK